MFDLPCPSFPCFLGNSLFFFSLRGIPFFLSFFLSFSRDFRGSVGIKNLCFFLVVFLAFFQTKQKTRKGRTGLVAFQTQTQNRRPRNRRNRRNRKPEPLEPFHNRTVTEPNRTGATLCYMVPQPEPPKTRVPREICQKVSTNMFDTLDPSAAKIFVSVGSVCIRESASCPILKGNLKIQREAKRGKMHLFRCTFWGALFAI